MASTSTNSKSHFTKRVVESLAAPERGEHIYWDVDIKGFGLRISARGKRSYFIQARTTGGRQIKLKIGVHGALTIDQARDVARRELAKLALGQDPAEQRRNSRLTERQRLVAPTMREFAEAYIRDYAQVYKRNSSVEDDRAMLGLSRPDNAKPCRAGPKRKSVTILAQWGNRKLADIKRRDIAELHRKLAGTPAHANRVLALLSKMFNLAAQWELRADNPVKGLPRYPEEPRERYLDQRELKRLAAALAEHTNQVIANAIRLLLLTGARRSEVLQASWDQFDLEAGIWTKPSAHTKQKRSHRVPLSPVALELLSQMRAAALKRAAGGPGSPARLAPLNGSVFSGRSGSKPLNDIKRSWKAICFGAQLENVRLHDLRHTYASLLASEGLSLPIIGRLLGHTQPVTTARYAHLLDDPLRAATGRVGQKLDEFTAGSVSFVPRRLV